VPSFHAGVRLPPSDSAPFSPKIPPAPDFTRTLAIRPWQPACGRDARCAHGGESCRYAGEHRLQVDLLKNMVKRVMLAALIAALPTTVSAQNSAKLRILPDFQSKS
jgi:hypothetical protein